MNVLFVTRKYPPMVGGMENLSYQLTTGFRSPKSILSLGRSQKHLVWFLPFATLRTAAEARHHDVVHLGDALLGIVGLIPRLLGRPVAVTVHGLDLTYRSRVYQWYLRRFLNASAYIAVSESTRAIAVSRGLSPVHVIPNGVAEAFFELTRVPEADPQVFEKQAGKTVLLTVGRLVPRKGVAWFVRHVLPELPDALYVVVGSGPERDAIERAAREAAVADRVLILGKVSEHRLHNLLRASDIFVMPNVPVKGDVEGFGIVAVEAAAAGLPVVAARVDGIPDAVHDGENGVLVAPGDARAFVTALRALVESSAARLELGRRAREYTRHRNGWPSILARHEQLFLSLRTASNAVSPDG